MNAYDIIEKIEKELILPSELILSTDVDAYLSKRDADEEFEKKFLAAFDEVTEIADSQIKGYDELHLLIFKKIDTLVGTSELSCYVAEDFELILKSIFKETNNQFVHNMLHDYLSGKLPHA